MNLESVQAAAKRLIGAAASGNPCPPVRDLIGADDIAAAYAVQRAVVQHRLKAGARAVGRKIGLTSEAVQQQLGVDQPDFGVLFDDMAYANGDTIPYSSVLQARVEAEVAFVLKDDLADGPLDAAQVRAAIDYAVAAVEVCGSRVMDGTSAWATRSPITPLRGRTCSVTNVCSSRTSSPSPSACS